MSAPTDSAETLGEPAAGSGASDVGREQRPRLHGPGGWFAVLRREPRWLAGLAVAVAFALVCGYLAQWQLDRRLARAERNAAVQANYDSEPARGEAGLAAALPGESVDPLPGAQEWTPVALSGRYRPADTLLVRNRVLAGANGYLVAVPFTTTGGVSLLLVRGWVPAGADAAGPDLVPAPPSGDVEVVARLRAPEPPSSRRAPPGQTQRLDTTTLGVALTDEVDATLSTGSTGGTAVPDGVVTSAYGVVAEESPTAAVAVRPLARPDTDPGPHLAYGIQWYLFAVAGFVIWAVLFRRHALAASSQESGDDSGEWTYRPGE